MGLKVATWDGLKVTYQIGNSLQHMVTTNKYRNYYMRSSSEFNFRTFVVPNFC